jgi:hypothetical protein
MDNDADMELEGIQLKEGAIDLDEENQKFTEEISMKESEPNANLELLQLIPSQYHRELVAKMCEGSVAEDLPPILIKLNESNQTFIATDYNQVKNEQGQLFYRYPATDNYYDAQGLKSEQQFDTEEYDLELEKMAIDPFKHYCQMYYGSEAVINVYSFKPAFDKLGLAVAICKKCTTSREDESTFELEW